MNPVQRIARTPVSVCLIALPETTPAALFSLFEVLSSVGLAWPAVTGEGEPHPGFGVRIVAQTGGVVKSGMGIPISPHAAFDDIESSDILIATDLDIVSGMDPRGRWPEAVAFIRRMHEGGALVSSVCTGSLLLAEAGLLDGHEATTHWAAAGMMETCYPNVCLRPERILVHSGEAHGVVTSGGASSWIDLALYLIARYCGREEAIRTAKIFLLGDHSEGQLPYSAFIRPRADGDAVVTEAQGWLADNYQKPHPVAEMVRRSGLAERTFKRRFKQVTGYSPVDYVQTLRIEEAKQMLETGDLPADAIAYEVGYEDPAFFRKLFKRMTGVTPSRYRRRYQTIVQRLDAAE
ncbi:helix-turn-helix domain-containing protein [Rhizobiales bacterium]|nr:helix-turn-helix domain-containing protein [Hongsoonwoonella zoysiae]NRG16979.1 helix-turn-helix domain-containing protein [Hongsoonwoonella zoysiae]